MSVTTVSATQALGIIPAQVVHLVTWDYMTGRSFTDCGIRVHTRDQVSGKRAIQTTEVEAQATCPDCVPMHQFDIDIQLLVAGLDGGCGCGESDCSIDWPPVNACCGIDADRANELCVRGIHHCAGVEHTDHYDA